MNQGINPLTTHVPYVGHSYLAENRNKSGKNKWKVDSNRQRIECATNFTYIETTFDSRNQFIFGAKVELFFFVIKLFEIEKKVRKSDLIGPDNFVVVDQNVQSTNIMKFSQKKKKIGVKNVDLCLSHIWDIGSSRDIIFLHAITG